MKKKGRAISTLLVAAMLAGSLAACSSEQEETENVPKPKVEVDESIMVEFNGEQVSLADVVAKAQDEGDIQSVGMPDDWANWKASWEGIKETYGITHADVDMTSAEEIAIFDAEKDDPTKDVGDIGLSMSPEAEKQDKTGRRCRQKGQPLAACKSWFGGKAIHQPFDALPCRAAFRVAKRQNGGAALFFHICFACFP